jgi:Icc-related predicted phosphoesterase
MPMSNSVKEIRFAAVGDLHCTEASAGTLRPLFIRAAEVADALLLCGDLTDYGTPKEARVLADELSVVSVPVIAVLGNHDFESDAAVEVRSTLHAVGVQVLDGEAIEVHGIGIAGAKGFAGGFGRASLGAWGEAAVKAFVEEALKEALKLESALAKLRTRSRIAMLHYAPIVETVQGEPPEIFAFLGSSRLEDPLLRYPVDLVVHGHAHRGTLEGRTVNGIAVYNVARPLLLRSFADQPAFRLLSLPAADDPAEPLAVPPSAPRRT